MRGYDGFCKRTLIKCSAFIEADYVCEFDDMEFRAIIKPPVQYIDSSYCFSNGEYYLTGRNNEKTIPLGEKALSLDLEMLYKTDINMCVFYPRISTECYVGDNDGTRTIDSIFIKIGENRYVAKQLEVTKKEVRVPYHSIVTPKERDYSTIRLGLEDINILREIVESNYDSTIRFGWSKEFVFTDKDKKDIRSFLKVCKKAGVFDQKELLKEKNKFNVITHFNLVEHKE